MAIAALVVGGHVLSIGVDRESAGDRQGVRRLVTQSHGDAPLDADLYRLLVESVRDYAIFALDPTGHIRSWNPGAERVKGYHANEIIGRHFSVFYPPEDRAAGKPQQWLETAAREGRFEDEGWRLRKDGSRFWANVVITALRDERGELVGFAKITRDLTDRRAREEQALQLAAETAARAEAEQRHAEMERLNEQLHQQAAELEGQMEEAQQLTEELEISNIQLQEATDVAEQARRDAVAANAAKSAFLAAMSHELRTPLNAMVGYVQLVQMGVYGPVSEAQRDALSRAQRSQKHLLALINDLLHFAKLEAGRVEYRIEDVSLAAAGDAVSSMIEPQFITKGIVFDAQIAPQLVVRADWDKLQQILLNLLTNAVKFTDPGGRVTIDATPVETTGMVRLDVTDTGCGIPSDKLEAIFDPFTQVSRTLTQPAEGTGLGLAISRDLARGMDGALEVRSIEGEGATFTLLLRDACGARAREV